jgi:hypothetical protein
MQTDLSGRNGVFASLFKNKKRAPNKFLEDVGTFAILGPENI